MKKDKVYVVIVDDRPQDEYGTVIYLRGVYTDRDVAISKLKGWLREVYEDPERELTEQDIEDCLYETEMNVDVHIDLPSYSE